MDKSASINLRERVNDPSGGANQSRVRAYNERLVLSLVRRHGQLPKSEIARRSGLSPQTVSIIMRALEADGLLLRCEPQRGRVGQPSIPMKLDPDGAYSVGLKIGRRSADLVLIDFLGETRNSRRCSYAYPRLADILEFACTGFSDIQKKLPSSAQKRIAGIGVSMPFELWNWAEKFNAPHKEMLAWRKFNFSDELSRRVGLPVHVQNDATSACGAELAFGLGSELADFVYFFAGTFIGGGVVLNHALYSGRTGNAGALGTMPVPGESQTAQLIDRASIFELEQKMQNSGLDASSIWESPDDWSDIGKPLDIWLEESAKSIAFAIVAACSVIDFEAAIIDGSFPAEIRHRLVRLVQREIVGLDLQGIDRPDILEGTIGHSARAIGGASQPLFARYLLDQNVLFKEPNLHETFDRQ